MQRNARFAAITLCAVVLTSIAVAAPGTARADRVYQWTDPSGATVFSDEPPDSRSARDVRTIQVQPAAVIPSYKPLPRLQAIEPPARRPPPRRTPYHSFTLIRPENNEAIRKNSGDIFVESRISPELQPGDVIRVYLDGEQIAEETSTSFNLPNLDRGTHTLEARVYDNQGVALASAQPVRFTVIRTSLLHDPSSSGAFQPRIKITNPIIYDE